MIPRVEITAAEVARSLEVSPGDVVDVEPAPFLGARASLSHAFRIARPGPRRALRLTVFPYVDAAWDAAIRRWLADERACVLAWWAWVANDLGRDAHGVWRIAPLAGVAEESVRVVEIAGSAPLLGLLRPALDWPDLGVAGLSEDRALALWAQLALVLRGPIAQRAGVDLELPAEPLKHQDARRRLLTDGRHLAPSSFRPFLAAHRHLDDLRPRVV